MERLPALLILSIIMITGLIMPQRVYADDSPVILDFETGVGDWQSLLQYGDVSATASSGPGKDGTKGLAIDYELRANATNHIVFLTDVELDLSFSKGLAFEVKGEGEPVQLFLFIWDSKGRFNNYGPHGTNPNFHSGYHDWQKLECNFQTDHSIQGGDADLSDIRKLGWMLWSQAPVKGCVCFDNIKAVDAESSLTVSPSEFSPNKDGVNDFANIVVRLPKDTGLHLELLDAERRVIGSLLEETSPLHGVVKLAFDGSLAGKLLPEGDYLIRARFSGTEEVTLEAPAKLVTRAPWPEVNYELAPFFPIGVWYEGAPSRADSPSDLSGARAYYVRTFKDLAGRGINTVAVPNCPEVLWEELLQSAEECGIKVVLEVTPLVEFVSQSGSVAESTISETVNRVCGKLDSYSSLIRYQIRDEPAPHMVENWLLVRRLLAAVDSRRPAFSCFCRPDVLASVTDQTPLTEAVIDIYPHYGSTEPQSLGDFLSSLSGFKAVIQDNDWWAVLQAFATPDHCWRYPSPEELSAVTYLSLAEGAKGVFYFIYQYAPTAGLLGMVEADGTTHPIYTAVSQLAGELRRLAPVLLNLRSVGEAQALENVVVGLFSTKYGQPVVIVASTRPDNSVTAKLDFSGIWKDVLTGEILSAEEGILTVPLGPGRGRVLRQLH